MKRIENRDDLFSCMVHRTIALIPWEFTPVSKSKGVPPGLINSIGMEDGSGNCFLVQITGTENRVFVRFPVKASNH